MAKRNTEEKAAERNAMLAALESEFASAENTQAELIDPLMSAQTVDRGYSKGESIDVIGNIPNSVEMPQAEKIVIDLNQSQNNENLGNSESQNSEPKEKAIYQDMSDEDKKEQKVLSNNFADSIVDGYKFLTDMLRDGLKKTEAKYQFKAIQGKFNMKALDFHIDMGGGTSITYREFVEYWNQNLDDLMRLNPDVEKEMRDVLKRIAMKRGLGMSDEARLAALVIQDAAPKVIGLLDMSKVLKNVEQNVLRMVAKQSIPYETGETAEKIKQATTNTQTAEPQLKEDGE